MMEQESGRARTIVVGAGLAGLACARVLEEAGRPVLVLEAADDPGGRVRTVRSGGYVLDRGFQVLFTAYPAARRWLDYDRLTPRRFDPGALIRHGGRWKTLSDPLRDPLAAPATLATDVVTVADKLRTLALIARVARREWDGVREIGGADRPTIDYLRRRRFSPRFIDHFARPFYGGIFLERGLDTSARVFAFTFKMATGGDTIVPAGGMGELARQIAGGLREGSLRTRTPVRALLRENGRVVGVRTDGGELRADRVVLATDARTAAELTGLPLPTDGVATATVYFASAHPLVRSKKIMLNPAPDAFINNATQLTNIAPEYAPPGRHLLSCSVLAPRFMDPPLDDDAIIAHCRAELADWFPGAGGLEPLGVVRIPFAQFTQPPGRHDRLPGVRTAFAGLYLAAEFTEDSSINGALRGGEAAAGAILAEGRGR